MKTLAELQKSFLDNIIYFKLNNNLKNPSNRFNVYHNNWLYGHIKALAKSYPVCKRLTGESFFEGMAAYYIQSYPSTHYSFNYYGKDFPEFIKNFSPASSLIYLSDVATLEWTIHQTMIDISNSTANEIDKHLILNENFDLKLTLLENGRLIQSEYPIYKIWKTNQDDYQGESIVDLNEGSEYLFVFRDGFNLKIEKLEKDEWSFMQHIQASENMHELFNLEEIRNVPTSEIIKTLSHLIGKGYVRFVKLPFN